MDNDGAVTVDIFKWIFDYKEIVEFIELEFLQMVISLTYVEVAIMHSRLDDDDQIELSRRFNDKNDSLQILIIIHAVNAAGVNLDGACSRVVVLTLAINYAIEGLSSENGWRGAMAGRSGDEKEIVRNGHGEKEEG